MLIWEAAVAWEAEPMAKRTSTQWYIGAWVVWVITWIAVAIVLHSLHQSGDSLVASLRSGPVGGLAFILELLAFVMFGTWIGALLRLARDRHWNWFVVVAALHLIGLGIVGMIAYAVRGPDGRHGVQKRFS
jgi:hypothetical protein